MVNPALPGLGLDRTRRPGLPSPHPYIPELPWRFSSSKAYFNCYVYVNDYGTKKCNLTPVVRELFLISDVPKLVATKSHSWNQLRGLKKI